MPTPDWYEVTKGSTLCQSDLLMGCPVPKVSTTVFPLPDELDIISGEFDLIVLTQSCDLENSKVDEVLLALVQNYETLLQTEGLSNPYIKGRKFREGLVKGDQPAYSLLPERSDAPALNWSLVDFHQLFTLPKDYVERFADSCGPRLRLVPPYREHLAQAFARYMMRVGLPSGLTEFVNYSSN